MADYINRNEVLKWKETITTDDYSGNETMDVVAVEEILDIELADVVEREKILDFIEDNRPTDVQTDWERGCAYICDEIEKLLK